MAKRFDLVVARTYEQNGEKKTQWQNCGVVFQKEDGKMWGELRSIPMGWDGRFQLFEPKAEQKSDSFQAKVDTLAGATSSTTFNSELPF